MNDEDLRTALHDAVEDVDPTDRLAAIRHEIRSSGRGRRAWWVGGGALVAASVVTVALLAGSSSPERAVEPAATPEPPATTPMSVYYVGPGPSGPDAPDEVLYRAGVESSSPLDALTEVPADPDYRTLWPEGTLVSYTVDPQSIDVVVGTDVLPEDELAFHQLVFTLQDAESSRAPVRLVRSSSGSDLALGFERADDLDVLSHMSIDEPAEGATFSSGESITVTGRGNSFEASGQCSLEAEDGSTVDAYLAQMRGWIEPRLYPWELEVDLTDVPPGTYTVVCITDDPTGGTEGRGTDSDTRTVVVE